MDISYILDKSPLNRDADVEQAVNTASALTREGARLRLIFPWRQGEKPLSPDALQAAYQLEVCPELHPFYTRFANPIRQQLALNWALPSLIRKAQLVYTRKTEVAVRALRAGAPVALDQYKPYSYQPFIVRRMLRWCLKHPNFRALFLHSALARQDYLDAGFTGERLIVAHNGVDLRRFTGAACELDTKLPDQPFALYAGRVRSGKGLRTICSLARQLPALPFVIVGADGGDNALEQELGSLPNITLLPWCGAQDLPGLLQAASILIIPPVADPLLVWRNTVLPLKTFSYLAAGRAIVAPATPDLIEILIDGQNALLVPPGDLTAAGDALRRLQMDVFERERLGKAARRTADGLTWTARAELILSALNAV